MIRLGLLWAYTQRMSYVHDWNWRPGWRTNSFERIVELVVRWLILAFAVWVAAAILPGIHLHGLKSGLFVALVLGLLNLYLKPVLEILSLPVTIITLGLFLIVINAILLLLASWLVGKISGINFHVDGFWSAVLGAIIIAIVSFVTGIFLNPRKVARTITG